MSRLAAAQRRFHFTAGSPYPSPVAVPPARRRPGWPPPGRRGPWPLAESDIATVGIPSSERGESDDAELVALGIGHHDVAGDAAYHSLPYHCGTCFEQPLHSLGHARPSDVLWLVPAAHLEVDVQPVLDHLRLRHLQERDARPYSLGVDQVGAVVPFVRRHLPPDQPLLPAREALRHRSVHVAEGLAPERGQAGRVGAVDRDPPHDSHGLSIPPAPAGTAKEPITMTASWRRSSSSCFHRSVGFRTAAGSSVASWNSGRTTAGSPPDCCGPTAPMAVRPAAAPG